MIAMLFGKIARKRADEIVLNVSGVGYRVSCSLRTAAELPEVGKETTVHIVTIVREDAFNLYGFNEESEKDAFKLLISVSGVGPRVALAVLSRLTASQVGSAVVSRDLDLLCSVPGVGKKTAERIIVDLKDKIKLILDQETGGASDAAQRPPVLNDLVGALVNLGYQTKTAQRVATQLRAKADQGMSLEGLIRAALQKLAM
ncbi:MAG: Holliday junction branch migration protein RuvA [Deltaproteobacteria bacterium]|nr:Holliday junction branch migration protein RuvA [Deltaproteobacteria bacterium]